MATKTAQQLEDEIAADEKQLSALETAPVASPAPVASIEKWGALKGLTTTVRVPDPAGRRPATMQKMPDWRFAAIQAGNRWPQGLEMTEAEFDAGAARALNIAVK